MVWFACRVCGECVVSVVCVCGVQSVWCMCVCGVGMVRVPCNCVVSVGCPRWVLRVL